jgi:aminoglycoside phosphotransferase (APT) family kinase protein
MRRMDRETEAGYVRAILAEFDPRCRLSSIDRPTSGVANTVRYVTTTHSELVLRVFDDRAGPWKSGKEHALYEHMRSIGIPAPTVVQVDTTKRVVPFIYSLTERIDGEPYSLAFASLTEAQNSNIYRSLGDYLGKLHSTTLDRFGEVYGSTNGLQAGPVQELDSGETGAPLGPFTTWVAMHRATVNARLRCMEGTAFEDLIPAVQRYAGAHHDQIAYEVVPRLLHMDLHRGNILIKNGEVRALLDVEEAVVGHNEYDLMRTELANFRGQSPAFEHAFLRAYQAHVRLDEGYALRKTFHDVSRTLVWIKSLILYGDKYAKGAASQSAHAAREHLLSLVARNGANSS